MSPRLFSGQVSVSPQGFPNEKICLLATISGFLPLFTGQQFIVLEGLLRRDSTPCAGMAGLACPGAMASGADNRHGAGDSQG